jgi:glycyl-tRNA synthetase
MPASFDDIVNLSKRRGFVFQSSEIYGGLRSAYDYGPLGVLLLRNVKEQWWKSMVQYRDDVVGLDSAILQSRQVWVASGHEAVFTDPLVECTNCNSRHRLDKLDDPTSARPAGSRARSPSRACSI